MRPTRTLAPWLAAFLLGVVADAFAGFAGTDLFLPMVGRQAGVYPSNWYTTLWIHNPGEAAATATISFLKRNTANPSPPAVDVLIGPGDTEKIENVVESLFQEQAFGALRVACATQRLVVTSRVYSKAAGDDEAESLGQDFAGVPAAFAIGAGERTAIVGVHQTLPAVDSEFRFNFGFVETTGHSANVRVSVYDENGAFEEAKDFTVREFSQRQVAFKDHFTTLSSDNLRLEAEVVSGAGRVIAYGSMIANASQDPTTFEMTYADSLLGIATVQHDATLAGDGTAGAPLGLADGAVTLAKLATTNAPSPAPAGAVSGLLAISPKVLATTDGSTLSWQEAAAGDITAVNTAANSGLIGGAAAGTVDLAIAAGGVSGTMLAADSVSAATIADGAVGAADVGFSYAGSASKGGAASDLACTGCVAPAELAPGSNGQALRTAAGVATWQTVVDGLALPYSDGTGLGDAAFAVAHTGTGAALKGTSLSGDGVSGASTNRNGVFGSTAHPQFAGVNGTTSHVSGIGTFGSATAGAGVRGFATSGHGVEGESGSGTGVYGWSAGPYGVHGVSTDGQGAGVFGVNYGEPGTGVMGLGWTGIGVRGYSVVGHGVEGETDSGIGVFGRSLAGAGVGVSGSGSDGAGVEGTSGSGYGVHGHVANSAAGVDGDNSGNGAGVRGSSGSGFGVIAVASSGTGLQAAHLNSGNWVDLATSSLAVNAHGGLTVSGNTSLAKVTVSASSSAGSDIFTISNTGSGRTLSLWASGDTALWANSTTGVGVDARSTSGNGIYASTGNAAAYAGYFSGKGYFSGAITKAGGGFKIDHPLAPDGRYLYHSFVESPDMKNFYDGTVVTDADGRAAVELPEWFEALNRDFRYQLTVIGRFAQAIVEQEVADNRFVIRTNLANVKVSWQITGIRKDAWADANRLPVEEEKPPAEQGTFLHPELFGADEERSVERALGLGAAARPPGVDVAESPER